MNTMKIQLCLLGFLAATTAVHAQNALTVEEAVSKRWQLEPKAIQHYSPQWIPGTHTLTYMASDWSSIAATTVKPYKTETIISLGDLQTALGIGADESMANPTWLSDKECLLQFGNNIYKYNLKSKKGEKVLSLPAEGIENEHLHAESEQVAYTIGNNLYIANAKKDKIAVTTESNLNIVSGQSIARNEFGISEGIFWSPKGSHLAFYQKDESNVTNYPLLNINTVPAEAKNIKYPMTGQGSEYARVGIFDTKSQKVHYLKTDGSERDQYLTNLAWSPDEKSVYVAVVNRGQNHVWLNRYNAKTGDLEKTILEETSPRYTEPEHPVYFMPDGKEFLWFSEKDGFMHLYRYNADGSLIGQLTKGKWVVLSILGTDSKHVYVRGTDESGLNVYAYSVEIATGQTSRLTTEDGVHDCFMSSDSKYFFDSYSNLNTPRVENITATHSTKPEHTLTSSENPLKSYKVGKVEMMDVKADDGTALHCRLVKPSHFNPNTKYPVLIYVYGGPHAQMIENSWLGGADPWMLAFAEKGYLVFTLDNRGSANRGFEFESVIHRQLGTTELADQLKGVEYLKSLPYVDAKRLGVHGWSFGGFMTLTMLLRSPETFDVGVAGGAVTDWKYYEVMYGERYMDTPQENPAGYQTSSVLNYVQNLKADLLVVHGAMDDVVVPQHIYDLMQRFISAGKNNVDLFLYPNQKHGVGGKERLHLMLKMLGFIEEGWKN